MKVRNFPGRKALRQARAAARQAGLPEPKGDPSVTDVTFRVGAACRGADGVATMVPA